MNEVWRLFGELEDDEEGKEGRLLTDFGAMWETRRATAAGSVRSSIGSDQRRERLQLLVHKSSEEQQVKVRFARVHTD